MSRNEDVDLLLDAVSDHMDIAYQAGVPAREVVNASMLAVAQFLIDKVPVDSALVLMRAACDDLQARMPKMEPNSGVRH